MPRAEVKRLEPLVAALGLLTPVIEAEEAFVLALVLACG